MGLHKTANSLVIPLIPLTRTNNSQNGKCIPKTKRKDTFAPYVKCFFTYAIEEMALYQKRQIGDKSKRLT